MVTNILSKYLIFKKVSDFNQKEVCVWKKEVCVCNTNTCRSQSVTPLLQSLSK